MWIVNEFHEAVKTVIKNLLLYGDKYGFFSLTSITMNRKLSICNAYCNETFAQ